MAFKIKHHLRSVVLHNFSGEIQDLEYPSHLSFAKKERNQYGGTASPNNIKFCLKSENDELYQYAFYNASFDFRKGHFVSILTSEKSAYHRLVINHNTQRIWFPNKDGHSISKEGLWEKYLFLLAILCFYTLGISLIYFLISPYLNHYEYFLELFFASNLLLAVFIIPKLFHYLKRNRNEYLYERTFKPQLKELGRNILKEKTDKIARINS